MSNTAVDWFQSALAALNALSAPPATLPGITEDFTYDDRRSGINFGEIDSSGWLEFMVSHWDVGFGRPLWSMPEVIAVHGQRTAAFVTVVDYGNDMFVDFVACLRLNTALQMAERLVNFDTDDVEAAIAELNRMHSGIETGNA